MIRSDRDGFLLDVDSIRFAREPDAVYEVPDTPYWAAMVVKGELEIYNPDKTAKPKPRKEKAE